jgi:hypothetical protein
MSVSGIRSQLSKISSLVQPKPATAATPASSPVKEATSPAAPSQVKPNVVRNLATDGFDPPRATGGVDINPSAGTASANASVEASGSAGPVSGSVKVDANIDAQVERDGDYTTVTVSADASVTAEGSLDLKAVSIGGSATAGGEVTYQVRLKNEDYEKLKRGEIPPPNPFDPSTIPDGGSVQLDQSQFKGTELEAGFKYNAAKIGLSDGVTETEGTSLRVERDGDKVQVTAGPTESISRNASVSLGVGPASIELGNNTTLSNQTFATAEFDLSTRGGRNAYAEFSRTGKLPSQEGPGVGNVLTVQDIDFRSESDLQAKLGPLSFDLGGGVNTGHATITTHPDGSKDVTAKARYATGEAIGPELTVTRSFDAAGTEDKDKTRYSYNFDQVDETARQLLYVAHGHSPEEAERLAKNGEDVQLTYSQDQLTALADRAREVIEANPHADSGLAGALADAENPEQVARALTAYFSNQAGYAEEFYRLALDPEDPRDGDLARLPGTISSEE